uniref:Uncharacterized protein n=1 Tax=Arion vulgaris TaxID=1028688 RepID=A0A0B7BW77_9EUPU
MLCVHVVQSLLGLPPFLLKHNPQFYHVRLQQCRTTAARKDHGRSSISSDNSQEGITSCSAACSSSRLELRILYSWCRCITLRPQIIYYLTKFVKCTTEHTDTVVT